MCMKQMDKWAIRGDHGCNGKKSNIDEEGESHSNIPLTSLSNHLNHKIKFR